MVESVEKKIADIDLEEKKSQYAACPGSGIEDGKFWDDNLDFYT